ncbi:MAG: hypothetical protein IJ159_04785 [Prevotella sp.]|nr:hypothetical protein [Prevotella sp.]
MTSILLAGCVKDDMGGVMIKSNTASELLCVAENSGVVSFYASGRWTATTVVPWLSIEPTEGLGGETLQALTIMTTEMNRTGEVRTAAVIITSGGKDEVLEIHQRGEYATFDVHEFVIPAAGGAVDVGYQTNVERGKLHLYCTTSMKDWLQTDNASTLGSLGYIRLLPNDDSAGRDGYFYLMIETEGDHPQRLQLDALHIIQKGLEDD